MAYGADFYNAVTLAIQASGSVGLRDLEAALGDVNKNLANYQALLQAGVKLDADQLQAIAALTREQEKFTEAVAAANRVIAGQPAQLQATGQAARGASDAILQLSRGLEDLATGGPIGILNNLPGVARGIGTAFKATAPQIAAAETAVGLLGTAAYVLYTNWGKVTGAFADGLGPKVIPDVKELNAQLDALQGKTIKSLTDLVDIRNLEREIDLLERRKKLRDSMGGPTDDETKRGKVVAEGAREGGGLPAIEKVVREIMEQQGSGAEREIRGRLAAATKKAAEYRPTGPNDFTGEQFGIDRDRIANELRVQQKLDAKAHEEAAKLMTGSLGEEKVRREFASLYDQNRDRFTRNGVTFRFRQALENASPQNLHAEEQDKIAKESEKEYKEQVKKKVDDAIKSVKAGFDDALADAIQDAIAGGTSREDAMKAQRPALEAALKARKIDGEAMKGALDSLLDTAADTAENNINEGAKSKLDTKADAAQRKAEAARKQAESKHDAAINKLTTGANAGFHEEQEVLAFERLKAGRTHDQVVAALTPDVAAGVGKRGDVPADAVNEVAAGIVRKVVQAAQNHLDAGTLPKRTKEADAARDAEAKRLSPAFIPGAMTMYARNAMAVKGGAVIARSQREATRAEAMGQDWAYSPQGIDLAVQDDAARHLRKAGQDPGLAPAIQAEAFKKFQGEVVSGIARTGNENATLIGIMEQGIETIGRVAQQAANRDARIMGLQRKQNRVTAQVQRGEMNQRRMATQGPTLLTD